MTKAERMADTRANETPEERRARQQTDAIAHAAARDNEMAATKRNWPTHNTLIGEKPGVDFTLGNHTDSIVTSEFLLELNSGGWIYFESMSLIAYIHVMERLEDTDHICKLNSLLELSIERHSTLLKTLYQEVLDDNDLQEVKKWMGETEDRQKMNRKEAVFEWFATNDFISLEDRKSKLPKPWLDSLVGLNLEVPFNPGKIDRIDYTSKDGKLYIYKSGGVDYPVTYSTVKKYNSDKNLDLPKDEPYIDSALNVRCEETLQRLRKLDGKYHSTIVISFACRSIILFL